MNHRETECTMDSDLDDWLQATIKRWSLDQAIDRVLDSQISSTSSEGYLGDIWRVSLEYALTSGVTARKRFVLKVVGETDYSRLWNEKFGVFKREIQIYTGLLSKMETLMIESGDREGKLWARLYGHTNYSRLLLNDLNAKGYAILNQKAMIGLEDSLFIVRILARFHALSRVLLEKGRVRINEFGPSMLTFEIIKVLFFETPIKVLSDIIRSSWGSDWLDIADKLKDRVHRALQTSDDLLISSNANLNVINHGDFKAANLMIKRDDLGRAIKCKIIDFQLSSYSSLACDLHFFLAISVEPNLRRSEYEKLIQAYSTSLGSTLRFYGYDENLIPSPSQINEEMRRCSIFGFMMIPVAASLTLETDKVNMEGVMPFLLGEPLEDHCFNTETLMTDKFKQLYGKDIYNFVKLGYLY